MVTKNMAVAMRHGEVLHDSTILNADKSPARCRVNGKCKTWKTRPLDFRLPVKYGLKKCFYVTPSNAAEWSATSPDNQLLP